MKAKGTTEVLVAIDGPEAQPTTVEPLPILQLATSWFRFATKLAEVSGQAFKLRGIAIRDKCTGVASVPSNVRVAQAIAARSLRIIADDEAAPEGVEGLAEDLRGQVRGLSGRNFSVAVHVGDWSRPVLAPAPVTAGDTWERTELRVVPVRVGGRRPTATLVSRSEGPRAFTVALTEEAHARSLGANLYREVDVELRLCRNEEDVIKTGEVLAVHVLDDADPATSWRAWFKENAGEWDDVDNILVELGRRH